MFAWLRRLFSGPGLPDRWVGPLPDEPSHYVRAYSSGAKGHVHGFRRRWGWSVWRLTYSSIPYGSARTLRNACEMADLAYRVHTGRAE